MVKLAVRTLHLEVKMNLSSEWQDLAQKIASGQAQMSLKDLLSIMDVLNFGSMNEINLPGRKLADKKLSNRKWDAVRLVCSYWDITVDDLMMTETTWIKEMRENIGSSRDDEKEKPEDLIVPQILSRIVSSTYFLYQIQSGEVDLGTETAQNVTEVMESLNNFISNACQKGRTRSTKITVSGKTVNQYNFFVERGIPVGGSGLFLPDPVKNLPEIFAMFFTKDLSKKIYK